MRSVVRILVYTTWGLLFTLQTSAQISVDEYADRRASLLEEIDDGIILFKANASEKEMEQPGWVQNASFYYFTGLGEQPSAILALDGASDESHLFVPPAPLSFGVPVAELSLEPGPESASGLRVTSVQAWSQFTEYVQSRLSEGPARIYLEQPRRSEESGNPDAMLASAGKFLLWEQSVREAFPSAEIVSITETVNQMRWVKSLSEVELLRANAQITAEALMRGARAIAPGRTQRDAESAVVSGCLEAGAQGPSFWPWTMSGPNTLFSNLVRSFYAYESLNREMQAGELVRVDVGCGGSYYGGDVGRTIPVSGNFSEEQARVWNLLVAGYMAGVEAMRPGVSLDEVIEASRTALRTAATRARDDRTQAVLSAMLDQTTGVNWHVHGVGIESGEAPGKMLEIGVVLAYEPMFVWNGEGYYLEDMIAITDRGAEVLSTGLPYSSEEIAGALAE